MHSYKATYLDKRGKIETQLLSDGSTLFITLRGFHFHGASFDNFELTEKSDDLAEKFELSSSGELINFSLLIDFSIKIRDAGMLKDYLLQVEVVNENETLVFHVKHLAGEHMSIPLNFTIGDFEYVPIKIQQNLPPHMKLEICAACRYSHYWVAGNQAFGDLRCFKSHKKEAEKIKDKGSFMEYAHWKNNIVVQETFSCEEFAPIRKTDWNYKDWDRVIFKNKS